MEAGTLLETQHYPSAQILTCCITSKHRGTILQSLHRGTMHDGRFNEISTCPYTGIKAAEVCRLCGVLYRFLQYYNAWV